MLFGFGTGGIPAAHAQQPPSKAYIDPSYLTDAPFGTHSHWLQPWRAYQETIPAQRFLDAQGIVLEGEDLPHAGQKRRP
jgi:hypothetical protein